MDRPARRIPAWKRLGLKLKNDQSGGDVQGNQHQLAEHQHDDSHIARGGTVNIHLRTPTRVDESQASLGKRKHPAEDDGQTLKKSRKTQQQQQDPHGNTAQTVPAIPDLDNGAAESIASTAALSDNPRPKGDPNYRKKKGRKSSRYDERKSAFVQARLPLESSGGQALERRPRTPSLSPGQLDLASDGATLLVSTETDFPASSAVVKKDNTSASNSLSPRVDRRKSVTFTPDTKTADGNSASNLFKKWTQEQKGSGAEFSQTEVAQFAPPPKSHPANNVPAPGVTENKEDRKAKKADKKAKRSATNPHLERTTTLAASTGKRKDPSRYTAYLTQYHTDRTNWKFNKAKQNDILENALNIFRIPDSHSEALIAYVKGLRGAGVIETLKERCIAAIEEIDVEMSTMDDAKVRKAAQEEALQEHISREQKRRRLEGDIENMLGHPYSEGYIQRLKRGRAQALLTALNLAAPAPSKLQTNGLSRKFSPEPARPLPPQRESKKPKRGTNASSDESSDSSDSSDSSSSSSSSSEESSSASGSDTESDSSSNPASSASSDAGDTTADVSSSEEGSSSGSSSSSSSSSGSESGNESEEHSSDSDSDTD